MSTTESDYQKAVRVMIIEPCNRALQDAADAAGQEVAPWRRWLSDHLMDLADRVYR